MEEEQEKTKEEILEEDAGADVPENTEMPVVISCSGGALKAPAYGQVVPQADIPDQTFAEGILGEGIGIQPELGVVIAPCDGVVSSVADSKHAIGITGPNDMEVLIHVGVETVDMKGEGVPSAGGGR